MTPLQGKRIAVTRPKNQAQELADLLHAKKAHPIIVPLIEIKKLQISVDQKDLIHSLSAFDLILLTSANSVNHFVDEVRLLGKMKDLQTLKIASMGGKTTKALIQAGLKPWIEPPEPKASEELAEMIRAKMPILNKKILFPRAKEGRDVLIDTLEVQGAQVSLLPVYETLPIPLAVERFWEIVKRGEVDWITFTSGSAVHALFQTAPKENISILRKLRIQFAVLGRVTQQELLKYDMEPTVVASHSSVEAMVAAMEKIEEKKNE